MKAIQLAKVDLKDTTHQYELLIKEIPSPDKVEPAIEPSRTGSTGNSRGGSRSMSGAIGRAVEVLSTGGGLSVKRDQPIQSEGLYVFGFFSLVLAVLKLTIEVHWSWWRVLLPLGVFLGHNLLHVLVGFICLFFVKYGEQGGEEECTIVEAKLLTGYKLGGMLCFLIFLDNLLRWMERGGNSAWFWLCSGKLEVVVLFGLFSLVAQFLYWSEIVGELSEQQGER